MKNASHKDKREGGQRIFLPGHSLAMKMLSRKTIVPKMKINIERIANKVFESINYHANLLISPRVFEMISTQESHMKTRG